MKVQLHAIGTACGALAMVLLPGMLVAAQDAAGQKAASVKRGEYLVQIMSCNDCHTPLTMGPRGPEPDMTRALTGHPESLVLPAPPAPAAAWEGGLVSNSTNTAHAGPWGVSFSANLTPDKETGLGDWTEAMFVAAMRTKRHQGKGRPILPPMPVAAVAALTEQDAADLFTYLQSLAPVHNRVPEPIEPPDAPRP